GAAAYLGQAPRLQNADLITAAVSIHNVEAQHAAALGDLLGVSPAPNFGTPKTMEEVLAVVSPILMAPGSMPTQMPGTGGGGSQHQFNGMRAL
ncbi:MAG: ferritin-like domain-containing protein, partial [Chloroflexi bacterium]|nr:ferritin-like domain-containing protein [Chloroflexota bacterium]